MIYRISFTGEAPDYRVLMDTMARIGDYCYSGKSFFLDTDKTYKELKGIFDGFIEPIGPSYDLSTCSELVRKWCLTKMELKALKEFEESDEGQSRMKEIMAYLDAIEEKRRKEGVKEDGKTSSAKRTRAAAAPESTVKPKGKRTTG